MKGGETHKYLTFSSYNLYLNLAQPKVQLTGKTFLKALNNVSH